MYRILTLPGDGIGPEVMDATLRVLGWFGKRGIKPGIKVQGLEKAGPQR